MTNQYIIGVDIGGVLIDRVADGSDTSFFSANYLLTPEVQGAFDALRKFNHQGYRVHLVSKCGSNTERKTLEWLQNRGFYAKTGVRPSDVHFCRKRNEKAGICTSLGVTHFVDDRLEVLSYLTDVPSRYLLNSVPEEVAKYSFHLPRVKKVDSWSEIEVDVLRRYMVS